MLNILVTGADGQLGSEMRRLGAVSPNNYLFTDVSRLDITDAGAVDETMRAHRTDIVINCAAYTQVERAETDADTAMRLNRTGVKHLADAARRMQAVLFHISTDYVFDGRGCIPYTEEDPTAPINVYGRTKLAGERAVAESGCDFLIFRTGWLYSEFGNNFLKTMLRLTSDRDTLNVVSDQVGTPTYAGDLAMALFSVIEGGHYRGRRGIYHFADEGVCSWYDFAVEISRAAGHTGCNIVPCRTADYPTRAARPAYSVLDKTKIKRTFGIEIPHWRESMLYCLQRIRTTEKA